jgi:2-iminobutanoate/2-iminopropanoate deaminase
MKRFLFASTLLVTSAFCNWQSVATTSGHIVYVSGQFPINHTTGLLANENMQSQTSLAIQNMQTVLKTKGAKLNQVIKTTVYLVDIRDYAAMDFAYSQFFNTSEPPAREVVAVSELPNGCRVQISCVADTTR